MGLRQVQRRRPPQKTETDFATNISNDELRRAIVAARALQEGQPLGGGGTAGAPRTVSDIRHRVHRWTVLRNRLHHETAARTIEHCVRVLQPLMLVLRTACLSVEEFFPRNERLLGLNTNSGQRIQVRLRPAARPESFLPFESVLHTLAHEVTHNFISPHNKAFFELHERITSLCERLIALGAMDGPGSTLALPGMWAPNVAAAAAAHSDGGFRGPGRTLGGAVGVAVGNRAPPAVEAAAPGPKGTPRGTAKAKFPGTGRVATDGPTGTSAGPLAAAIRRRGRSGDVATRAPDYETMRAQMLRAVLLRLAAAERAEAERHMASLQHDEGRAAEAVAPVCTCGTDCIDVDAACADGDECSALDDDDDELWTEEGHEDDHGGETPPTGSGFVAPASYNADDEGAARAIAVAAIAASPVAAVVAVSAAGSIDPPMCTEVTAAEVKHEVPVAFGDSSDEVIVVD
jgi:hypothetical protein